MSAVETVCRVTYMDFYINQLGNVLPLPGTTLRSLSDICFQIVTCDKAKFANSAKQIALNAGCTAVEVTLTSRPAILVFKGLNRVLDATEFVLDRLDPLDPPDCPGAETVPFQGYLALGSHDFTSTPKTSLQPSHSPASRFLLWQFLISEEESRVKRIVVRAIALPFRFMLQFMGWVDHKFSDASPNGKFQRRKIKAKRKAMWIYRIVLDFLEQVGLLHEQRQRSRNFDISGQVSPVRCTMRRKLEPPELTVDVVHSQVEGDRSDSGADLCGGTSSEGETNSLGRLITPDQRDNNFNVLVVSDAQDKGYDSNSSKGSDRSTKTTRDPDCAKEGKLESIVKPFQSDAISPEQDLKSTESVRDDLSHNSPDFSSVAPENHCTPLRASRTCEDYAVEDYCEVPENLHTPLKTFQEDRAAKVEKYKSPRSVSLMKAKREKSESADIAVRVPNDLESPERDSDVKDQQVEIKVTDSQGHTAETPESVPDRKNPKVEYEVMDSQDHVTYERKSPESHSYTLDPSEEEDNSYQVRQSPDTPYKTKNSPWTQDSPSTGPFAPLNYSSPDQSTTSPGYPDVTQVTARSGTEKKSQMRSSTSSNSFSASMEELEPTILEVMQNYEQIQMSSFSEVFI